MMSSPTVSVIMAAYNRGNIIGHSIESLLRGSMPDWELIVVGDACTDDTAQVVQGFADPRIRFVNLEKNCGEQSGPNNTGMGLARGRYFAFLNHDDLWFPDHLARSLAALEGIDTPDLVFGLALAVNRQGAPPDLIGATAASYHPLLRVPASLWVFRRELYQRIGPWRAARDIRRMPSQDWLYRARAAGARVRPSPHLAALIVSSIAAENSYRDRRGADHAYFAGRMRAPGFAESELAAARQRLEVRRAAQTPLAALLEGMKNRLRNALMWLGVLPPAPSYWLRYWRKGSYVRALRRRRGLPSHY